MPKGYVQLCATIPEAQHARLKLMAKAQGKSVSLLVRRALLLLEMTPPKDPPKEPVDE